ncbi:MAG: glycoside hydrolase N-terminal domain-containing protein, partial [Bacteroidota bacterium]|nr:glycoside hydrolase N-terminal domain-containing protein [Bacteroidota bacterium]
KSLEPIRDLLRQKKYSEADNLASQTLTGITNEVMGSTYGDFGAQQTMGDLFVKVSQNGDVKNYRRELDLTNSIARVSYIAGNVMHKRSFFASYPKRVLVFRFENNAPAGTDYQIAFKSPHQKISETFVNHEYAFTGNVSDNGMEFESRVQIRAGKGKVSFSDGKIQVKGTKDLVLILTAQTEYQNHYPDYRGNNYKRGNAEVLSRIEGVSYEQLLSEHQHDYKNLFNRVNLSLGKGENNNLPTDERLIAYSKGAVDPEFEALYFQYSRYLMISSSRPGTMPMHLQGKWNNSVNPPWACDYHTNINVQMIYWPAEVTNLSECHLPLVDFTSSLVEPGTKAAWEFFHCKGWITNTMTNPFGFTSPGWGFPWGFYPAGGAWLCQHLWEHYAFTGDLDFLKNKAYPVMKQAALFWMDYLTKDENGELVSTPSYSPEQGGISGGASMDHEIAWDLMNNCVKACNTLNIDKKFADKVGAIRDQICKPKIGRWGQLQEWKEDIDDSTNHHRHVSHLFALYPGSQITPNTTPELAKAAMKSLLARGDEGTGWSLAWKINFWARLKDGDHAYKMLRFLLRSTGSQDFNYSSGGGTYANLFCAHPPFQIDGNMGGCAGIAEMLLQSNADCIELLPSLPAAWSEGKITGLKARGGFVVDIEWKHHKLTKARVRSLNENVCILKYGNKQLLKRMMKSGQEIVLD